MSKSQVDIKEYIDTGKKLTVAQMAIDNEEFGALEYALISGRSPEEVDSDGDTPLMVAAMFGNYPAAKLLIEHGADIYKKAGLFGGTAMRTAVRKLINRKTIETDVPFWQIIDLLLSHEVTLHGKQIIQINAQHSGSEEWSEIMRANRLRQRQWQMADNFRTSPIEYSGDSESYSVITSKIRQHEEQIQKLYDDRFVMPADWKPEHGLEALIPKPVGIEQHDEHESLPRSRSGSGEGLKESFYRGITSVAAAAGSVLGGLFSLGSPQPDPARQPLVPAHVKAA